MIIENTSKMSVMNFNRSPVVDVGCSREKKIYNNINLAKVATCYKTVFIFMVPIVIDIVDILQLQ